MGILSDFVVADRAEAEAIATTHDRTRWPLYRTKGITPLELAQLHFAITGADGNAATGRSAVNPFTGARTPMRATTAFVATFECVLDEGESWIHVVPEELVAELARVEDVDALVDVWGRSEALSRAEPGSLVEVVSELRRLARQARAERKPLLLWFSL